MSWSEKGALSLQKIKETILNNKWDFWWETERKRTIKLNPYKPLLSASHFKKEKEIYPVV